VALAIVPRYLWNSALSAEERRALDLLARSAAGGCTTSLLLAHGFSSSVVAELITAGLAAGRSRRMRAGQRTVDVTRVHITDAGRAARER
jgi:hypothetical protein